MKKNVPYIIIIVVIAAAFTLFITGPRKHRQLDERLTFYRKDKIPYGMYVAHECLKHIFPNATISENRREPGYWDSIYVNDPKQALIIISPRFDADEFEMKKLISFIENGNDVFISTAEISSDAEEILRCKTTGINFSDYLGPKNEVLDSFTVSLLNPPFRKQEEFSYPGFQYSAFFFKTDATTTGILGRQKVQKDNFIHLQAGKGNLYLHLAPLAFSNYFLLHANNIRYYENALSLINKDVTKVVWDEYYLFKRWKRGRQSNGNLLRVLFRYPALAGALLTALFTLLIYIVIEMRRKQRYIPVITKPRNDSLDFVKTIGRLYFDKGDHLNLCRKMAAYFLEHIRNVYKLPTYNLNEEFIKALQFKTGKSEAEISDIVASIKRLDGTQTINDKQLTIFHKQLESFYKTA